MLNKRILVLMFLVVFLPLVGCLPGPTNQAPILTSDPITTATVGVEYTYDVNATDPDGDTLTYSLATKPSGMTINSATGLIWWTPTVKGDYPIIVKVSDGALSITQPFTIKVGALPAVNQKPVIYSTPILTATVGVTYFYDVNATDPDGDTLTYSLSFKPTGMTISSADGLIWWTPTLAQVGINAVVVEVSDGDLSDTQSFTIVVSKPSVPPETYTITAFAGPGGSISPLGDVTVNKGSNIVFTITPTALYGIEKVLVDGSSVGAVNSYTFNNVAKNHTIHATFSAVEPVPPINHAPDITSIPSLTATVGVEYVYEVKATDSDSDVLTYSLTTELDDMVIDLGTGKVTWTPDTTGDFPVTVEVSDGALSVTQDFTIVVSAAEPALLTSIVVDPDKMDLIVGESKAFKVTAYYNDGTTKNVAYDCVYVSSDDSIAKELLVGLTPDSRSVKGLKVGIATITATYQGKTDKLLVTVKPVLLDHIVVLPDEMTLFVRETEAFKVTAHYNDTTTKNVTWDCDYESDNTDIASVSSLSLSSDSRSVKAGVYAGKATITVSYTESDITKTDKIIVTVSAVELDHIVVVPDEVTLYTKSLTGITQQLKVTAIYSDGFTSDITSDCVYVSSDSSIVSVDDNGRILAESLGTTTIFVTYLTDWIDIVVVTVEGVLEVIQDSGQNAINQGLAHPYISWTIDGLCIEFVFVNPTVYTWGFDYRVDGEAGTITPWSGITITGGELDGQEIGPSYNIVSFPAGEPGLTKTVRVCAEEEVWVGLRLGDENDWYLDWIKFEERW